jgi:hypothetical protein
MSDYDWVFWLNLTNIALGVVVFLAVRLVAYGIGQELTARYYKHRGVLDGMRKCRECCRKISRTRWLFLN